MGTTHRRPDRWSAALRTVADRATRVGLPLLVALAAADELTTGLVLWLAARGPNPTGLYEGNALYLLAAAALHVPIAALLAATAVPKLAAAYAIGRWWRYVVRTAERPYFDYAVALIVMAAGCALVAYVVVGNAALLLGALAHGA